VENWKRAKVVTKEGIQPVAVIIAEVLCEDMKTELFILKIYLFSFDIYLGQLQTDFSQKWQETHQI